MARARTAARRTAKSRRKRKRKPRPRGRPTVLTPPVRRQIMLLLSVGCSRNDAADATGIGRSTLHELFARDPAFSEQVKRAEVKGKVRHLRKVGSAQAWQASAWFLERKYSDEYARRVKVDAPPPPPPEGPPHQFKFEITTRAEHPEPTAEDPDADDKG